MSKPKQPTKKPTIQAEITEVEIKLHLNKPNSEVYQLYDKARRVYLRYHAHPKDPAEQKTASWYIVDYRGNGATWHKIGTWPYVSRSVVFDNLKALRGKLELGQKAVLNQWQTVGELLVWYRDRASNDSNIKQTTKDDIKSVVNKHLLPCLGNENIHSINRGIVDDELFQPLQARYPLVTVRQYMAWLKRAFNRAEDLERLSVNPLGSMVFKKFTDAKIGKARDSKLKPVDLPRLCQTLRDTENNSARLFAQLMLFHGTRKTETSKLRWDYVDDVTGCLVMPKTITKTGVELSIPLTDHVVGLLVKHYQKQQAAGYQGVYLFPSPTANTHISKTTAGDWIKALSNGEWAAHDLRKLARTMWAKSGVDYFIAEQLLNHALSDLNQAYIHDDCEDLKRKALEQWHQFIIETIKQLSTKTTPRPPKTAGILNLFKNVA